MIEAAEYGLADQLAREFEPAPGDLTDALTYCDMVTGPDGQQFSVEQRLAEIRGRYGPDDPVSRALVRSAPQLVGCVVRVRRKLTEYRSAPRMLCAPALVLAGVP
jgi:hypothetical protein